MKLITKPKKRNKGRIKIPPNLELFLVFAVAILQIMLVSISNASITQVSDISKYGFFSSQYANDEEVLNKLKDQNLDFRPNACKMISLYNENLELKLRFYFMETPDKDLVKVNQEFHDYVMANDQGYVDVDVGSSIEHVYFRWIPDPHDTGTRSLVTVRVNQPTYLYVWIYPIISCLSIILVFGLVFVVMLRRRQDGIEHYMTISNDRRYM